MTLEFYFMNETDLKIDFALKDSDKTFVCLLQWIIGVLGYCKYTHILQHITNANFSPYELGSNYLYEEIYHRHFIIAAFVQCIYNSVKDISLYDDDQYMLSTTDRV